MMNELLRHAATCHYHSKVHEKLKFPLKVAQLVTLLGALTCTISAQRKTEATQATFNPAAYRVGERLTYNVSFAHFVSAAHVELFVASRGTFFNREGIQLRAHAETNGVVNAALFALNNDYITYVDPRSGLPFRAQQTVREAGRASDSSIDYNQPAGIAAFPSSSGTVGDSGTYDLLSALYRIRAMPLGEGASYSMTVRGEGQEYRAEVKITGHQLIKTSVGSFSTVIARVNVKGGHDYNIRIYFSDDERHVPVLITARHPSGEIRAELAGSELTTPIQPTNSTTRPPQDSIVTVSPSPSIGANASEAALPDLPFKVGEQLNYQIYFASAPQPVGSVSLAVRSRGRYFNRDGLLFSGSAQMTNAGARAFFLNDQVNSYVDPTTLLPFRTELNMVEGRWRSTRNYNIDQNRGAAVADKGDRIEIPVGTHDLLSLIYAIRTFDLSPLKRNAISILAIGRPRTLTIVSARRETIQLGSQSVSAIPLSLTTDDPQADKLQLRLWVGDDARRLPLRITAVTQLGPVRADLKIMPATPQ